jgi:hypothetical protein
MLKSNENNKNMETNNQEMVPVTPEPLRPTHSKLAIAMIFVLLLAALSAGAYYYLELNPTSSQQEPRFYVETKLPEYRLGHIEAIMFQLKSIAKNDWPTKPMSLDITLEKPDGTKATTTLKLDDSQTCGQEVVERCHHFDFMQSLSEGKNFVSADQVGTWKLSSSSPLVKPLNFEVKTSRVRSIFPSVDIGKYKDPNPLKVNFEGETGGYELYAARYDTGTTNIDSVNVHLGVESDKPFSGTKISFQTLNPDGTIYLDKAPIITTFNQRIHLNECIRCPQGPIPNGFTIFTFSAGWPTQKGFVVIYGGLGSEFGTDEKEIVRKYLEIYPSVLK